MFSCGHTDREFKDKNFPVGSRNGDRRGSRYRSSHGNHSSTVVGFSHDSRRNRDIIGDPAFPINQSSSLGGEYSSHESGRNRDKSRERSFPSNHSSTHGGYSSHVSDPGINHCPAVGSRYEADAYTTSTRDQISQHAKSSQSPVVDSRRHTLLQHTNTTSARTPSDAEPRGNPRYHRVHIDAIRYEPPTGVSENDWYGKPRDLNNNNASRTERRIPVKIEPKLEQESEPLVSAGYYYSPPKPVINGRNLAGPGLDAEARALRQAEIDAELKLMDQGGPPDIEAEDFQPVSESASQSAQSFGGMKRKLHNADPVLPACMAGKRPDLVLYEKGKPIGEKYEYVPAKETDPRRIETRMRQIQFGKNTVGYDNYITAVPIGTRRGYNEHPRTPDAYANCSKRAFDGRIQKWRRELHKWDDVEKMGNHGNPVSSSDGSTGSTGPNLDPLSSDEPAAKMQRTDQRVMVGADKPFVDAAVDSCVSARQEVTDDVLGDILHDDNDDDDDVL